eukprot:TRINITY_DN4951_c0_g1_i1.p1 TRINITY_DN4951_c0_g1~~TRINITY_DN4951_c0_g1_i1.p1  ORF type:complete len:427 (+),score=160.31 TRINITY_DN4951_c0_g1_i1:96-1283(+)
MRHARLSLDVPTKQVLAGHADPAEETAHLEHYLCALCLKHTLDNMTSTICDHIFHKDCLGEWLKEKDFCPSGCGRTLPRESGFLRFKEVAPYVRNMMGSVRVQCPLPACGKSFPFEALRRHVTDECEKATFACEGCGEVLPREQVGAHVAACGSIEVDCKLQCGVKRTRAEMQGHAEGECAKREVRCRRCGAAHRFSEAAAHEEKCTGSATMADVAGLLRQVELLRQTQQRQAALLGEQAAELGKQQAAQDWQKAEIKMHLQENAQLRTRVAEAESSLRTVTRASALGVPPFLQLQCPERAWLGGKYTLQSEPHNGASVWCGPNSVNGPQLKLFRSHNGRWMIAEEGHVHQEKFQIATIAVCSVMCPGPKDKWVFQHSHLGDQPANGTLIRAAGL